jgi:hypothetical protein
MVNRRSNRRRFVAEALAGGASLRSSYSSSSLLAQQTASDTVIAISDVTVIDATGAPRSHR